MYCGSYVYDGEIIMSSKLMGQLSSSDADNVELPLVVEERNHKDDIITSRVANAPMIDQSAISAEET